jgi:peptide/nickel transport system substrate-binding protein
MAVMALSACGGGSSGGGGGGGAKFGGSLIDGISQEPSSLMVTQSSQTFADLVQNTIWSPPIYVDEKATYQPGLLKEVPSTANGDIKVQNDASGNPKTMSLTLKLRPNLKWSDGQPLTSADFAFTYKTFADPAFGDKRSFAGNEITSTTTPDNSTVVIQLNVVDVAFMANNITDTLNAAPIPQHIYSSMAPAQIAKEFTPSVTSGPFTVSEHVSGDHITVVKNKNYYQAPKPYLDKITFKFFPDANTEVTALQAGQIDTAYFLPVTSIDTLKAIPGYKLWVPTSSPNYEALYFNLSNTTLADPVVRQAIALGFDPRTEISQIQKGNAIPTCDDDTGTYAHEPNLVQGGLCPYGPNQSAKVDPAAAKTLLEGDGYTMGSDGYYAKGGKRLELRVSTTSGRQYRLDSEQLLQAQLKTIGIKIDVLNFPSSILFGPDLFPSDAKYAKGNDQWDIAEFENSLGTPDPDTHTIWASNQFPPAGGSNLTYYNNPQVDQWEAQQLTTIDQTARLGLFKQIHAQILKDIPTLYLYSPLDLSEYNAKLNNYRPDSLGPSETWNVWDWWLS